MPQKAHVTSLEAIELFRSNLIIYLSQARPALEEVSAEVMRTRVWLETEQCLHWESQMRRRMKELEQAQQALFSSRLGALRKETAAEQFAVHRAKAAVAEADLKLRIIRKWNREFEGRVQPMVKQMEKLHMVLSNDMVKAVTYLNQAIKTLAAYVETRPESRTAGLSGAATGLGDSAANKTTDAKGKEPAGVREPSSAGQSKL
jgi:hypothetical protein